MTNKRESRLALDHQIHKRHLKAKIVVIGDERAIKREFERIERTSQAKNKSDTQTKSPSAGTDGL